MMIAVQQLILIYPRRERGRSDRHLEERQKAEDRTDKERKSDA